MPINRTYLNVRKVVTLETIRELRHLLEQVAQTVVPYLPVQRRILLCLSEAVTNLVNHTSSEAGHMRMCFGRDNLGWWLEISDDGPPWDPTKYAELASLDEFREAESGRGVDLLHAQCDHIEYHSSTGPEMNCLRLCWKIPDQSRLPSILVVEDDEALRRLYALYLGEDFAVTTASTGEEALQALEAGQIDLVLSDICMPLMDGIALREQLIEDTGSRLIPFVFLTATTDADHLEQATDLGIDDYLLKPVDKIKLIGTIRRVLKRSRQIYQQLTERIDRRITSALAPRLPDSASGWLLRVASRHTGSGGGDLLLHQSGEMMFQMVLADIMGHDDSAKFFAHAYGGYLRGVMQALGADSDPARLLEQLSAFALQDKLMSKVTLTCCSATLSPGGGVVLACAGHPPPLHITKTGVHPIPVGGILPGLLPATDYQSVQMQLPPGERIALYTDGLFDSAIDNNARMKLEQSITKTLADTLDHPIDDSMAQIMAIFDQLAGTPPGDDALLLLMEPAR